ALPGRVADPAGGAAHLARPVDGGQDGRDPPPEVAGGRVAGPEPGLGPLVPLPELSACLVPPGPPRAAGGGADAWACPHGPADQCRQGHGEQECAHFISEVMIEKFLLSSVLAASRAEPPAMSTIAISGGRAKSRQGWATFLSGNRSAATPTTNPRKTIRAAPPTIHGDRNPDRRRASQTAIPTVPRPARNIRVPMTACHLRRFFSSRAGQRKSAVVKSPVMMSDNMVVISS